MNPKPALEYNGKLYEPKISGVPTEVIAGVIFRNHKYVWDKNGYLLAQVGWIPDRWCSVYSGVVSIRDAWQDAALATLDVKIEWKPENTFRYLCLKAIINASLNASR